MSQVVTTDGGKKYFGPWNNNFMLAKTILPATRNNGKPHPIKIGAPLVHINPKEPMRAAGLNMKALMKKLKKIKAGCMCDMMMKPKRKKGGRTKLPGGRTRLPGGMTRLPGGRTQLPGGKVALY